MTSSSEPPKDSSKTSQKIQVCASKAGPLFALTHSVADAMTIEKIGLPVELIVEPLYNESVPEYRKRMRHEGQVRVNDTPFLFLA